MTWQNILGLTAILAAIGGSIYYLETNKPGRQSASSAIELPGETTRDTAAKEQQYARAKELINPSGFLNTPEFKIADLVGKQVILVDFWTYSCINCQRTLPYLNVWHEKYGDHGLTIVGVHTPDFAFEKEQPNVAAAIKKYGVQYPVVQDNDYGTWRAYGNRYWPRKYLIDIDGFIVYDHIGEGAYPETEAKIQELLVERSTRLQSLPIPSMGLESPIPPAARAKSPEIYFGASRNERFGSGTPGKTGTFTFTAPERVEKNTLYLVGDWNITPEYAENKSANATVIFKYEAREVNLVAGAPVPHVVQVTQDGELQEHLTIQEEDLYHVLQDTASGEYVLELTIPQPGAQFFTFTFG